MSFPTPPEHPKPSAADRRIFRDRVKRALKAAGVSARTAEEIIGCATGTFSKVYSGRLTLTPKLLREMADQAKVPPNELVEATGLAYLLLEAPETPASSALMEANAEIDRLKADLAERDAAVAKLREQMDKSSGERDAMRGELTELRNELAIAIESARQEREQHEREAKEAANAAQHAIVLAKDERDRQLAQTQGRLGETEKQVAAWREFAVQRQARVTFLESELARSVAAARQGGGADAGHVLLAALAGLGIGAMINRT